MGRPHRAAEGGFVYHVLNRGNARMHLFDDERDYDAFEEVLAEAVERSKTRHLAYCLMPNHWHLVVWPRKEPEKVSGTIILTRGPRFRSLGTYGKTTSGGRRRVRLSRAESRQCADAPLRRRERLRRLRGRAGRGRGTNQDASLGLLPDAKSPAL